MPIFEDNTDDFLKKVQAKTTAGLRRVTALVERDAKLFCPVKTATLKRSITHEFIDKNTAVVGTNIEYAPFVELGTSKMTAKPYLRPALHKNEKEIRKILR